MVANERLASFGPDGVTLFFAISGFLITTLLLRERARNGQVDLRAFYVRRSLRIFPLYYAVLLLYVLLVLLMERHSPVGRQFFANLPFFLTYTSNIFVQLDGRVIFYYAWSLAAEEQFYVSWPPVMKLLRTNAAGVALLALISAGLIGVELMDYFGGEPSRSTMRFVLGVPLAIVLAAMMAICMHTPRGFATIRPFVAGKFASALWLAAVIATLASSGAPRFAIHASMVGLVLSCVARPDHLLASPLAWRPLAYVGKISYGLYLLHMLAKHVALKLLVVLGLQQNWVLVFIGTLAIGLVAAFLSFRYFESLFLARKTRFER